MASTGSAVVNRIATSPCLDDLGVVLFFLLVCL
jgi:hypothetical protein